MSNGATDDAQIYGVLQEIFRDVFMQDGIHLTPELKAADVPGWDSFKHIEVLVAAQERFGVRLSTREIDCLQSVGDLVNVLSAKVRARQWK